MRKKNRLIALLMSVCIVVAMIPTAALAVDPPPPIISIPNTSAWQGSVFGDVGGQDKITSTNFGITENVNDGSVVLKSEGDRGKIATATSTSEGIAYYYREIQLSDNFELSAKATVNKWTANSQVSFGIMLRSNKLDNTNSSGYTGDYVAVGALDQKMEAFYKQGTFNLETNPVKKITSFTSSPPSLGNVYDLSIKKTGNVYKVKVGNETATFDNFSGSLGYAGLFTSRNTNVTFSNISFTKDTRTPNDLRLNTAALKTDYFVSDSLNLTGLKVTAIFSDRHEEELAPTDYIVTGFDSSTEGNRTMTVNFNGLTKTIPLHFKPLVVTGIGITYLPAKTSYYIGEYLDPQGLVVQGQYNGGEDWADLTSSQYTLSIPVGDATVTNATYKLLTPGTKKVTVRSTVTSATYTTFDISVKNAQMTDLEIRQNPAKTSYFIGETFDQAGLVVYAKFSDNSEEKLLRSEYTLTTPDMGTVGTKTITVTSYKGTTPQPRTFPITVKQQSVVGIKVTDFPQTTYELGQDLDLTGLGVSRVYDSVYKEKLTVDQYDVVSTSFDKTKTGVYNLQISLKDTPTITTLLPIKVTEPRTFEWKTIRFGQSSSTASNKVNVITPGSAAQLIALEGGGKVTGDHDGISFYYVELDPTKDNFKLSANIKVTAYAKDPQDGQESFGIMARDAIGTPGDSSIFASNIAAIGGYSGATTKQNGTQLFVRTGITSPDGAGSKGIQSVMMDPVKPTEATTYPTKDYKLTLIKTNSGFSGQINDGKRVSIFAPDILKVQDQNKMYVGFYTARLATIDVSNISLQVSDAALDAPMEVPSAQPTVPDISFTGLSYTSETAYTFGVRSNVSGTVTIKQGDSVLVQTASISAGVPLPLSTSVTANTYTNFSAAFVPTDTQYLTSYDKIVKNFTVDMKTYANGSDIYVSPSATMGDGGDGTRNHPLDLDTAVRYVRAGQQIILMNGRYLRTAKLEIPKGNNGTSTAMKSLIADAGATPIIDFDKKSEGVVLSGSYWHVKGIEFTRSASNTKGFTIGGSHNIVEGSRFYANGDTGLQISRTDESEGKELWPSYNLILNCESFDNADPSNNNADGFAAKLTSGEGNIFRGDISHNNIDDGWDLYTKAATGAIGAVLIEDSIAYNNGTLTNGSVGAGDKNGFKLGGEGIKVPHIIRNSIAFGNGAYGFASNSNPGVKAESMNIAFNNAKGNLNFTSYTGIPLDFEIDGFISYHKDAIAKDSYPTALSSATNYLWNGTKSVNQSGTQLTDANFASLVPVLPYQRDTAGNLIKGDFLRFLPTVVSSGSSGSGGGTPAQDAVKEIPDGVQITTKPTSEVVDGKTITTVTVAEKDLVKALSMLEKLDNDKQSLVIAVDGTEPAAQVDLPAGALQDGLSGVTLSMRAMGVTYDLPLQLLHLADLASTLGTDVANMTIRITIEQGSAASEALIRSNIEGRGMSLLAHPIEFTLVAEAGGKQQAVNDFGNTYVSRSITLDGTVDANQSTTVWIDPVTGKFTFVPAIFAVSEGKTIVTMKRPGNSLYAVVKSSQTFDDVKMHWAKSDVELLASKGVIQGVTANAFAPDAAITRAEFAALLVRSMGLNEDGASSATFKDITPGSWYAGSVGAAAKAGLINGFEDATFKPNERITREQMAVMLTRAMTFAGTVADVDLKALAVFADANQVSAWSQEAVSQAIHAGIVKGLTATSFQPKADATRAEAAVMLKRFLQFVHFINE